MPAQDIIIYPDHRLRAPTKDIEVFDEALDALVIDLRDTLYTNEAVGISAIQIGRPERIFLLDPLRTCGDRANEFSDPLVLVNPEIIGASKNEVYMEEGCLSFPGTYVKIKRPERIILQAKVLTEQGWEDKEIRADGFFARVLQHEFDHLTGRLLIDMVSFVQKKRINKRFK